jgi:hypothetical protein
MIVTRAATHQAGIVTACITHGFAALGAFLSCR